jgi:hypothetical protein
MACPAPTIAPPAENVAFLTDVEGNMEYLLAYVAISDALELASERLDDGAADLVLRDGWRFVFGGDAVDKGGEVGGSIRVARTLVRLKRRYPDRVTVLIGNRDANKIRMTSELAPSELDRSALESIPGPYWVPEAKRVSPVGYLGDVLQQARGGAGPPSREELVAHNTLANRIRWMLKETMGADGEFERRRKELAVLRGEAPVTDEQFEQAFRWFILQNLLAGAALPAAVYLALKAPTIFGTLSGVPTGQHWG